jgi:hypothetical protein
MVKLIPRLLQYCVVGVGVGVVVIADNEKSTTSQSKGTIGAGGGL